MNNLNSAIKNIDKSHKLLNKIEKKLKNKIVVNPIIEIYVNKKPTKVKIIKKKNKIKKISKSKKKRKTKSFFDRLIS